MTTKPAPDLVTCLITAPVDGDDLARRLAAARLAARVTTLPVHRDLRWRNGELHEEPTTLIVATTTVTLVTAIIDLLHTLHLDDVCDLITLPIEAGTTATLARIHAAVGPLRTT